VMISFLGLNLLVGLLIWQLGPMDFLTSMLCAVPGGMGDTPLIAADMGADSGKVAVLQFIRMTAGIGVFPSLIAAYDRKKGPLEDPFDASARDESQYIGHTASCLFLTLAAAALGGMLGFWSGIPAGTLVASMLGVILLKLLTGRAWLPIWAKRAAQVLSGAYIGCSMGYRDLLELRYLVLPALVILFGFTVNCFLVGSLLHRKYGMERKAAMLCATPAGATDMALIASDIGVHNTDLIVIQIARMVLVISIFPQIIALLGRWLG
ncbi:MAG: AbrB family transcriptional regulator, partial [Oscillospiraceae bacterium]